MLGVWGYMFTQDHFFYVFPYTVGHLLLVMLWWHRLGDLHPWPKPLVPMLFLVPQGIYATYQTLGIIDQGLEEATRLMDFRFGLLAAGVLVVEYGLLYVFIQKPKYYRF